MTGKRPGIQRPPRKESRENPRGRIALAIFFVCFSLFVLNVLLGKMSIVLGWEGVTLFGDVPEFLLLLVAVTVFAVAFLQREAAENAEHKSNQAAKRED